MNGVSLMAPAFEPHERFYLLTIALEELPREAAADVLPLITSAAMVVVKQVMGRVTHAEAYAHVERARAAIEEVRRAVTPEPPTVIVIEGNA